MMHHFTQHKLGAGCAPLGLTPLAAAPLARARGISVEANGSGRSMSLDVDMASVYEDVIREQRSRDVDDRRRAISANRSMRRTAAALRGRGALRAPINRDPNYRGRLRIPRPANAPVGSLSRFHAGTSAVSSLPPSYQRAAPPHPPPLRRPAER